MVKSIRKYLILTLIFSAFVFMICETQITHTTGIIDKDRAVSYRLKNGSTGVLSVFGHKSYVDTAEAEEIFSIANTVCGFGSEFTPKLLREPIEASARNYFEILEKMASLFSEHRLLSEPQNAERF